MKRPLLFACAAAAALLATAAEARPVSWSVGIDVAPVAAYVSSGPGWYGAPVRYARPRAVYAPYPVAAPPVVYRQAAPFYDAAPVYVEPYRVAAPAVFVAPPRHRFWLPPLPRLPRPPWHHDGWHRDVGFRR